jgi:hypothetical protein
MKTVQANVEKLLELHWHLRNDDRDLLFVYWYEYDGFNAHPPKHLTSPSTIIRVRAKLQSNGDYLPTDLNVQKLRHIKQKEMRRYARAH